MSDAPGLSDEVREKLSWIRQADGGGSYALSSSSFVAPGTPPGGWLDWSTHGYPGRELKQQLEHVEKPKLEFNMADLGHRHDPLHIFEPGPLPPRKPPNPFPMVPVPEPVPVSFLSFSKQDWTDVAQVWRARWPFRFHQAVPASAQLDTVVFARALSRYRTRNLADPILYVDCAWSGRTALLNSRAGFASQMNVPVILAVGFLQLDAARMGVDVRSAIDVWDENDG